MAEREKMKDIYFHIVYCNKDGKIILPVHYPAVKVDNEICLEHYKISIKHVEVVESSDKLLFISGRENYKVNVYANTWKQDERFSRV
jgi:hypothetical protein